MSFALNESYSNHDLFHGMPWMAAMRTLSALRLSTLSGAAVSIFLLFFVHGLASRRPRALLTGLGGLVTVDTGLGLLFSGPWANRLHAAGDTGTSNPVVVLTLIGYERYHESLDNVTPAAIPGTGRTGTVAAPVPARAELRIARTPRSP
jgi:hypothetical protein